MLQHHKEGPVNHGVVHMNWMIQLCSHSGCMPPNWRHVVLDHQDPPGGSAGDYYDPLMVAPCYGGGIVVEWTECEQVSETVAR